MLLQLSPTVLAFVFFGLVDTEDDSFTIFTKSSLSPDHNFVTTQRKHFVVNVDACKDAVVYLTHNPGIFNVSSYQISIGTARNTKSTIRKTPPNEHNQEFNTPNILPCSSSQPMWVKWDDGELVVGTGPVVGENETFQWKDDSPYSINAFSLASNDDKRVNWTMLRDYGRTFSVSTIRDYLYDQASLTTYNLDSIVMRIKGCRDAHIVLNDEIGNIPYYTRGHENIQTPYQYETAFGISGNRRCFIREIPYRATVIDSPGIMSCTEFRYFWLRWKFEKLETGRGSIVGVNRIMQFTKAVQPQRILSIGLTTGWQAIGRWEISSIEGSLYIVNIAEDFDLGHQWSWFYPVGQYFEFHLRSCEAVHIRLTEIPKWNASNGFEIVLSNDVSSIIQLNQENATVSKTTPVLLDCAVLRKFWISWGQGVTVGKGKFGDEAFLDLQKTTSVSIATVTVTTPKPSAENSGEWQVKKETVKAATFYSPAGHYKYTHGWQTIAEERSTSFKVRCCADAYVVLAEHLGIADHRVYEIRIGSQNNSRVEIRHGVGGTLLAEKLVSNPLHCTQSRWFWIDWSNGISVGSGAYLSDSSLVSVSTSQLPDQFQVQATGFATGGRHDGNWEFIRAPDEEFVIHTPSHPTRDTAWLVTQRRFVMFRVRACAEARLLLAADPFDLSANVKEVVVGGWGNTKSVIYGDLSSNQTMAEKDTIDVLHCNFTLDFWVDWSNAHIAVGKSSFLQTQEFLRYDCSSLHEIAAISLSTGVNSTGEWQFHSDAVSLYRLRTSAAYDNRQHWYRMGRRSSVKFKVKTCSDACLILFDEYLTHVAYEIVLGGRRNRQSTISRSGLKEAKVQVSTPQILNCDELLPFWISWSFGLIKVGKGRQLEEEVIMQWVDPNPLPVSIVSISTGSGSVGEWELSSTTGGVIVRMRPSHQLGHFVQLKSSQQRFSFSVRACQDAVVYIQQTTDGEPVYELSLGIRNNTATELRRYENGAMRTVAQESTPMILDCSERRKFWMSWENGAVEIATADSFAAGRRFIEWQDDSPVQLHSVSLASGQSSAVEWNYDFRTVQTIYHRTGGESGDETYGGIMISVDGAEELVFGVIACRDASIAMSEVAGMYRQRTYELIIGTTNNTETLLRNNTKGPILKSLRTSKILNCNSLRMFWLSWGVGRISFGRGSVPRQEELISFDDLTWHPVNSLSFLTPKAVSGTWMTSTFSGNVYELHTPDDGNSYRYNYNIITSSSQTLVFFVKACNDARILLQSVPGSISDGCFEIVIGGWNNTRSVIRDKVQGRELGFSSHHSLRLNCESHTQFWMSWRNDLLEVGTEYPYTGRFLYYNMSVRENASVNAVSFSSGFGSEADWIVYETDVTSVKVSTADVHNYNQLSKSVYGQNFVVFRVQACRDAHLALSEVFNNVHSRTYEIIFGGNGNKNTFIRDRSTMNEGQRVHTPNLMNCSDFKTLWVKWEPTGRITAGQGSVVGSQQIIDWIDGEKRIFHGITISTWNGASGFWDFSDIQGDVYTVFPRGDYRYDYIWLYPINKYLTFKVKSCNDGHVLLSRSEWNTGNGSYEIVIGGYENSKSEIRREDRILISVNTPSIMKCQELLPFWIRWKNGTLLVGSGPLDSRLLMRVDDPGVSDFKAVSVTGWIKTDAEYQFLQSEVSALNLNSTSEQGFRTLHLSTANAQQVKFKVKSSKDVTLALLTVAHNINAPHYEITIGAKENTISRLKARSVDDGELEMQVDTQQILDSSSFRPFWISWLNGEVEFGKGETVGQDRVLKFRDPRPAYRKDVHSVAVASGASAQWYFESQFAKESLTTETQEVNTSIASSRLSVTSVSSVAGATDSGMIVGMLFLSVVCIVIIALITIYAVRKCKKKNVEDRRHVEFDNLTYRQLSSQSLYS